MRHAAAVITLSILMATLVQAHDLGTRRPAKSPRPWPANLPAAVRQGGDTMDDALPIDTVPHETTGTTAGYINDYDEACPYDGSVAPDVVYAFTPPFAMQVDIDMLGSLYDTKIYLYDQNQILVACNDDYYDDYVSKLEAVDVDPNLAPYYLVIDGYGEEFGEYTLAITEYIPCVLDCPAGAVLEGEPPLVDNYEDATNGGCNSPEWGSPIAPLQDGLFCGRGGWFFNQGAESRDTDWFVVDLGSDGTAAITIIAEVSTYLFELAPQDCDAVAVVQQVLAEPCCEEILYVTGEPNGTAWVWVGASTFEAPDNYPDREYDYVLDVQGAELPSVALNADDDYTFGAPSIPYPSANLSISASASSHDDADLAVLCAGTPTPGPDLLAKVYLAAGDDISAQCYPFYIAARDTDPDTRLQSMCLAVVSDLRDPDGTCLGSGCRSQYNTYVSFDSPTESGWYYLVADREVTEPLYHVWAWIWNSATPPPPPPVGDTCADAAVITPGPIAITADLTAATNAADPGRDGCLDVDDLHYTGRDLLYRVDLTRGQSLDVTMLGEGGWDEALYLVRDCENPVDNCVAAGQADGEGVRLQYTALDDETLWLVCDSWGVGPRPFTLTGSLDSITAAEPSAAGGLALRCAPTPFNPVTTIGYDLPRAGHARLRVHDLRGRLVATLVDAHQPAGAHAVTWRAKGLRGEPLASGAYVVRLESGGEARTTRVTVLK